MTYQSDWSNIDTAIDQFVEVKSRMIGQVAKRQTAMEFTIEPDESGTIGMTTPDPDAMTREYGSPTVTATPWVQELMREVAGGRG